VGYQQLPDDPYQQQSRPSFTPYQQASRLTDRRQASSRVISSRRSLITDGLTFSLSSSISGAILRISVRILRRPPLPVAGLTVKPPESSTRSAGAESFWYVLGCIAMGAAYFSKLPGKKAACEVFSELQLDGRGPSRSYSLHGMEASGTCLCASGSARAISPRCPPRRRCGNSSAWCRPDPPSMPGDRPRPVWLRGPVPAWILTRSHGRGRRVAAIVA
jgi:hypothetical protein